MMSDPIQDSDLARRNAEERKLILGARDNPTETKMPSGQTVAEFQAQTYEQHLAEARADEEIQILRTREQSIANDPFYQHPVEPLKSDVVVNVNEFRTRDDLMTKSKAELVAIAESEGVTVVPDSQTRTQIIDAILAAQDASRV